MHIEEEPERHATGDKNARCFLYGKKTCYINAKKKN